MPSNLRLSILLSLALAATPFTIARTESPACSPENALHAANFAELEDWTPFMLPGVERSSKFRAISEDSGSRLRAVSEDSGSGILWKRLLRVHQAPVVAWKWRMLRPFYQAAIPGRQGDDSPLRVCLFFSDDAKALRTVTDRSLLTMWRLAKSVKMLSYVASFGALPGDPKPNPHKEAIMEFELPCAASPTQWTAVRRDAASDYRRAFGGEAPEWMRAAVISDTDNTDSSATAELNFLAFCAENPE